jgi:hypothetical protein
LHSLSMASKPCAGALCWCTGAEAPAQGWCTGASAQFSAFALLHLLVAGFNVRQLTHSSVCHVQKLAARSGKLGLGAICCKRARGTASRRVIVTSASPRIRLCRLGVHARAAARARRLHCPDGRRLVSPCARPLFRLAAPAKNTHKHHTTVQLELVQRWCRQTHPLHLDTPPLLIVASSNY